ncbi:hypothetical protein [Actinacidiphila bryophytorum]|uniref:Ceramidase n=1 Tax=Actinacidiphila bryophytorum TaxID=1436133 RepID=A0A9W4EDI6_9ACTN|nr:hypothetical protein [Actinacidiphila bryophytorum]MBM9437939.1 hypothetical protein [Actinacidiphila bryophytorum]MBN6542816.1 hypothetical protein [Actinacidiphila bryophytorum]CAG7623577.1 putative Ceramidase [Actinacidiphila bryophytorum]
MSTPDLLVAAATADITPPAGHLLGGYADRTAPATGTADPLQATLIWLSGPADPGVLWLTLDAVAVDTVLASALAAAVGSAVGIPADRVLVCASHTHAAPVGWAGEISPAVPGVREPALEAALVAAAAAAARPLREGRRAGRLAWAGADAPGVGANRHRPDGPHDTSSGVLAVHTADGLLALLLDHASHPTVLGPGNLRYSADWPGATRRALAAALGPGVAVGFLQGAAGDVSPRFVRRGRQASEVDRLGGLLAGPVLRALADASPLPADIPRLRRSRAQVPVRRLPSAAESARTLAEARSVVAALPGQDTPAARLAQTRLQGAETAERLRAAGLPASLSLPIGVVTLGADHAWLHLPVELFASLGLRLRAASPRPETRVVGYTDGYFGYVPDREGVESACYEALTSYVTTEGAEVLVAAAGSALRHAAGR